MRISHIMCISKILTNMKSKNTFENVFLQYFSSEKFFQEHKETTLKINGKQSVKLRSGSIGFKNNFKHLAVPFEIYADFEPRIKGVKSNDKNNALYTKKYQSHISFAYKVLCIDDKFSKPVVLYR